MEELKRIIKNNGVEIICFLLFFYVFYMMPPICDRLLEHVAVDFEDPWRFIFGQYRWLQNANGRVLSNIFSYFVDKNPLIHAAVNALMIVVILCIICKISNSHDNYSKILTLSCLLLVPWGIKREIYLYATTLYISAAFLGVVAYFYINKIINSKYDKKDIYVGGFIVFLASVWIENTSLAVFIMLAMIIVYSRIKKIYIHKIMYLYSIISFLGLVFMYMVSRNSKRGRLNQGVNVIFDLDGIKDFFHGYTGLLLVFSVVLILGIKHYKTSFLKKMTMTLWFLLAGFFCLFLIYNLYCTISTNPVMGNIDNLKIIYGWGKFEYPVISDIFFYVCAVGDFFVPVLFVVACILLIIVLDVNGYLYDFIPALGICVGGSIIYFLGLQSGDKERLTFTSVIALILIMVKIRSQNNVCQISIMKKFIVAIAFFAIINADTLITVVTKAYQVEQQRMSIVSEVKNMQAIGEWDYRKNVVLPSQDAISNHKLVGDERLNPSREDVYYHFMLNYYDLDENTIILFE